MYDISAALQAFFEAIKELAGCRKVTIENQTTTEIVDDKRDYKKAINYAEKIILITDKYVKQMSFIDRCKYYKTRNKFYKWN